VARDFFKCFPRLETLHYEYESFNFEPREIMKVLQPLKPTMKELRLFINHRAMSYQYRYLTLSLGRLADFHRLKTLTITASLLLGESARLMMELDLMDRLPFSLESLTLRGVEDAKIYDSSLLFYLADKQTPLKPFTSNLKYIDLGWEGRGD
jgi:hypothetical protein